MDAVEAELRRVAALEAELRAADEQVEYWRERELRAAATEAESRRPAVAAPPRPASVEPEPICRGMPPKPKGKTAARRKRNAKLASPRKPEPEPQPDAGAGV
eukprot:COSAG04_NODE_17103_length_479_cov_0.828947_1_plen_101_part_01